MAEAKLIVRQKKMTKGCCLNVFLCSNYSDDHKNSNRNWVVEITCQHNSIIWFKSCSRSRKHSVCFTYSTELPPQLSLFVFAWQLSRYQDNPTFPISLDHKGTTNTLSKEKNCYTRKLKEKTMRVPGQNIGIWTTR